MYKEKGYLSQKEYSAFMPSEERFDKGAVAIIECPEHIPCNPCQEACPRNAIERFKTITDTPIINFDQCNGCGSCIAACPGLAIYVIHKDYKEGQSLLKIPYELLPIPSVGETCEVLNRAGEVIGEGEIVRVQSFRVNPKGRVLWISIPKEIYKEARNGRMVNS